MEDINWNDNHNPEWRRVVEYATTADRAPSTIAKSVSSVDGSDIERHWAFTPDHGKTIKGHLTTHHVLQYVDLGDDYWFCED